MLSRKQTFIYFAMLAWTACQEAETEISAGTEPMPTDTVELLAGELLVKLDGSMPTEEALQAILGDYRLERVFPVDSRHEMQTRAAGLHRWYRVLFDASLSVDAVLQQLSQLPEVEKVEANRRMHPDALRRKRPVVVSDLAVANAQTRAAQTLPFDDPHLFRQWGFINPGGQSFSRPEAPSLAGCDLNCAEAWQLSTGDPAIIVAVLDEGVMYAHPDLSANMWVNEGEELHAGQDADGNGYVDDKYGYNFVTDTGIINPYSRENTGHGSHVAGTIAAVNNNGIGCCGIAGGDGTGNGVRIMSLQIIDGYNSCTLHNEAKAMKYAADNGAVIMQCSWGYNSALADQLMGYVPGPASTEEWAETYPLEKEALDYFLTTAGQQSGVLDGGIVVFAAGNESAARPAYPSAYDAVLCVGSIAADYTPSTFSNYGAEVDFSAPGGDSDYYGLPGVDDDSYDLTTDEERGMILSTLVIDEQPGYGYFEGTSMACPAVSGVVALALSYARQQHRHYTNREFIELMRSTARDLDGYYQGTKTYHYYHTLPGTTTRQMSLANWRGKMGLLPDAGALLRAVAVHGQPMRLPNVAVALEKTYLLRLSDYYTESDFAVSVADTQVATAAISDGLLSITGHQLGMTTATVRAGGEQVQITITVTGQQTGYGWL